MNEPIKRLPPWLVHKTKKGGYLHQVKASLRARGLHTVCESARCPNIGTCFSKPTATFLILGDRCTRNCAFCSVDTGPPRNVDPAEPERVAAMAAELGLRHVVVTSVTRDDLKDGGAAQFVGVARAVRAALPQTTIELLTPDFQGNEQALTVLARSAFDVFNHNLETVSRLYPKVRPEAQYDRSLFILKKMKQVLPKVLTKSGLMVGLGESLEEVTRVFEDLSGCNVDAVTVGQYIRPTKQNLPVASYLPPQMFREIEQRAKAAGLRYVASDPLVRSSFNAEEMLNEALLDRAIASP